VRSFIVVVVGLAVAIFVGFSAVTDAAVTKKSASAAVAVAELQTTVSYTWTTQAPVPITLFESQGIAAGGKLYAFGGFFNNKWQTTKQSYAYDPASNSWQRLADLPELLTHAAITVDGATIYLLGGYAGNNPGGSTRNVWKYDTTTNTWSAGTPLPADRGGGGAAIVDGKLHFFGGATRRAGNKESAVDQNSHWVIDLRSAGSTWQAAANLPRPRNHMAGVALNGKVYAIGGQLTYKEGSANQNWVDVYDPATNKWSQGAAMPTARGHISASTFIWNGGIVVIGGSINGGGSGLATDKVERYDPQTNTWTTLPPIPGKRKTPVADAINGRIIVSNGGTPDPTNTTWVSSLLSPQSAPSATSTTATATSTAATATSTAATATSTAATATSTTVPTTVASATTTATATATLTPTTAPQTATARINAGGGALTLNGVAWSADTNFSDSKTSGNTKVTSIAGTTNDALYQTARTASVDKGSFSYNVPVPATGRYLVRLHFAELWWGATGGGAGGQGKRVFSVNAEGGTAELSNLDLNSIAAPMTAITREFVVAVNDTTLNIVFSATIDRPIVNGIEVLPAP
jgi:hypothetical protein